MDPFISYLIKYVSKKSFENFFKNFLIIFPRNLFRNYSMVSVRIPKNIRLGISPKIFCQTCVPDLVAFQAFEMSMLLILYFWERKKSWKLQNPHKITVNTGNLYFHYKLLVHYDKLCVILHTNNHLYKK